MSLVACRASVNAGLSSGLVQDKCFRAFDLFVLRNQGTRKMGKTNSMLSRKDAERITENIF